MPAWLRRAAARVQDARARMLPMTTREEQEAKVAMPGPAAAAPAPAEAEAALCDFCGGMPAVVYCRADSARLCLPCDRHVHGANTVSTRHARAPLCAACRAAPAAFRRRGAGAGPRVYLCSNCDFETRRQGDGAEQRPAPLHDDRGTVEGYTGCPSIGELAAILGVAGGGDPSKAGWWPVWEEEPQVLSLDDVIVATTFCHGFQPLLNLTPSTPKDRSSPDGEMNGEVLRQLRELGKSEATEQVAAYMEAAPAGDQLPSWASSQEYAFGHGDFGTEVSHEAASMAAPSCEHEAWMATNCTDLTETRETEIAREPVPASSSTEPCLSTFVDISEICPSLSRSSSIDNGGHDPATPAMPTQALPKKGVYDIAYPDRGTVISRYKEKRKNRKFDKQIRYESRKARADGRLRIKGRFAKSKD